MFVILNPLAGAGSACDRWPEIEKALRRRHPDVDVVVPRSVEEAMHAARGSADACHDAVVAAGGDGSVNLVLNCLMNPATDQPRRSGCALGAIGLGSSNDFHKPFAEHRRLGTAPARIDSGTTTLVDVGRATMVLPDGSHKVRYFLLNASMGLVAEGNHLFNSAQGLTRWLKGQNVEAAILVAALRSLLTFEPFGVKLEGPDWDRNGTLTNVSVLKRVHFAGGMRYDSPVTRDDGMFDVNVMKPPGRLARAWLIAGLYRGRFRSSRYAFCRRGRFVELYPDRPSMLELDGEITTVVSARLEVLPRVLKVCG